MCLFVKNYNMFTCSGHLGCYWIVFTQNIPSQFLEFYGNEIPEVVKLQLPDGLRTRVHFVKEDRVFKSVQSFFEKFCLDYGICAMFTYNGDKMSIFQRLCMIPLMKVIFHQFVVFY